MFNKFLEGLKQENNKTYTENGARALKSTESHLVDLFGTIGSMRIREKEDIERLFVLAFHEDPLIATKMAFYARNIRGGLGERRTFRIILQYLATTAPDVVRKNMSSIPMFGRYDDLYTLVGTSVEEDMWQYVKGQLAADIEQFEKGEPISLLAKWLKSVNASSKEGNELGKLTAKKLGFTHKEYRKALAMLRKYIDVTEVRMSGGDWTAIQYEKVPSRAMMIYRNAFKKHDEEGFKKYMESLVKGEVKVNAATLYPYDIMEKMGLITHGSNMTIAQYDPLLQAQWDALPNYVECENNILVMADTSGSMCGRPMCTSIGLAIYFATRNKGAFRNVFMTFSTTPSLVTLKGKTLYDQVKCIPSIVSDTNLEAAFELILKVAKANHLTQEELPKSLVIVTDMEFNYATHSRGDWTFYESMRRTYGAAGYQLPNVVFWNVNARNEVFQVTSQYEGVQMASGQSTAVFKTILANMGKNSYEAMLQTLNDPVYDQIVV